MPYTIDLKKAIRICKRHGCEVKYRGGEVVVRFPSGTRVTCNNRRKDANCELARTIRRELAHADS